MPVESIRVQTTCAHPPAWHGGCANDPTCSRAQSIKIAEALDRIYAKVDACGLTGLTDLKNCIRRSHLDTVWNCAAFGDDTIAQTFGGGITLAHRAFALTDVRFEAIVFHELIHRCGGTELDAEAFENHCYRGSGAFPPTPGDFTLFRLQGGRFVDWNPTTGAVTTKDGQRLNVINADFVDPSAGGRRAW